ncbi:MAG: TonB-dependent receptor [Deltaproteobacteria bacterium]|nr:TonB-dependent receptor [Deltaproteobacteria bacterium]
MNVRLLSALLLVFTLSLFSNPGWCDENADAKDYEVYDLGEIVVSGKASAVRDIAVTNTITAEEIQATNSTTVSEALNHVPGLYVVTGRKSEPEIYMHGFKQHKVLVLIDGVPYYETKYGKLDLNQIPTDIVAKIEVIKGAASVLYGANAEAGVINVVTKAPTEKPAIGANVEFGENHYNKESVYNGMKIGKFSYWLNYSHQETDGWDMANGFDPVVGWYGNKKGKAYAILEDGGVRNNSDSRTDAFWAKFGLEPTADSKYYVNLHVIQSEKGMPLSIRENKHNTASPTKPAFSQLARSENYDDWGIDLSGRQKITGKLTLREKLFYHNHTDDYVSYTDPTYSTPMSESTYKDYMAGGSLLADYKATEWDTLSCALHYTVDSHEQRDDAYLPFEESKSNTGSIAIENEFAMIKNLSIVVGVSYDWFDVTDAQENGDYDQVVEDSTTPGTKKAVNPMIGMVYTFADSTKLFGSVAQKTRFPTLSELYGKSGNQELNEEQSINYTLGISRTFFEFISAELSLFHHDVSDWISRDGPYGDNDYMNWGKITMSGVEFNTFISPIDDLTLNAGYTYTDARDRSDGRLTDNVTDVPEHALKFAIQYTVPRFKTRVDMTGVYRAEIYSDLPTSKYPTLTNEADNYWLFGARITQPVSKYFELYVAGNNLCDYAYEEQYGFPGEGRSVICGLTAKF